MPEVTSVTVEYVELGNVIDSFNGVGIGYDKDWSTSNILIQIVVAVIKLVKSNWLSTIRTLGKIKSIFNYIFNIYKTERRNL